MSLWERLRAWLCRGPEYRLCFLFVCRANITRSPYLEHRFRQRLEERYPDIAKEIGVASAGVEGFRRAAADPVIRFIASQRGLDLLPHASQGVSHRLIEQADWVFTLEESFTRQLLSRFRGSEGNVFPLPKFGTSDLQRQEWDITDPTGKEAEAYEAFADLADQQVERLLDLLEGELLGTRRNLVLIGLPGAGKTTLGKELAEHSGWAFLDTDERIEEEEGQSLQSLVDSQGYLALREVEESVLCGISCTNTVIATGGSAVYSEKAMSHLRQLGPLVWLDLAPEVVESRIGTGADRGLAKAPEQTLPELIAERNDLYARWAEHRVCTDQPEPDPVSLLAELLPATEAEETESEPR